MEIVDWTDDRVKDILSKMIGTMNERKDDTNEQILFHHNPAATAVNVVPFIVQMCESIIMEYTAYYLEDDGHEYSGGIVPDLSKFLSICHNVTLSSERPDEITVSK